MKLNLSEALKSWFQVVDNFLKGYSCSTSSSRRLKSLSYKLMGNISGKKRKKDIFKLWPSASSLAFHAADFHTSTKSRYLENSGQVSGNMSWGNSQGVITFTLPIKLWFVNNTNFWLYTPSKRPMYITVSSQWNVWTLGINKCIKFDKCDLSYKSEKGFALPASEMKYNFIFFRILYGKFSILSVSLCTKNDVAKCTSEQEIAWFWQLLQEKI